MEMRLIDADDAVASVVRYSKKQERYVPAIHPLLYWLENEECFPTVDAVPVIRCKDCKYFQRAGCFSSGDYCTKFTQLGRGFYVKEDGYCWKAERKEEE